MSLAGDRPYKVDAIDPWEMTVTPVGTAPAGEFTVSPPKPDLAFRFTPYRPGEKLRPEARITASVTEGVAAADGAVRQLRRRHVRDGTSATARPATRPNPTHVFQKPGLYAVTLTVTDADGGSARSFVQIAVDRKTDDPIVRAGFPEGEMPSLTLARHRAAGRRRLARSCPTARRGAGCRPATRPLEDLRGLRSFTILGWLKPESLQVGSGGNRIVFCLNSDHSGIDLVCHAGRPPAPGGERVARLRPERQFARQTAGRQVDVFRRDLRRDANRTRT